MPDECFADFLIGLGSEMPEEYDDDFIDGLDPRTTTPLCQCEECGCWFEGPKQFEAGVHNYCGGCYEKMQKGRRPPLGLIRKNLHDHIRATQILGAIRRYVDAGKEVPEAWIEELQSLPETGDRDFAEIEDSIRRYNVGVDPKKLGVRVMRFRG